MKSFPTYEQPPLRRDLTDPRSTTAVPRQGRTPVLNDARSTRAPRGG